jgi:hypothetical protein
MAYTNPLWPKARDCGGRAPMRENETSAAKERPGDAIVLRVPGQALIPIKGLIGRAVALRP